MSSVSTTSKPNVIYPYSNGPSKKKPISTLIKEKSFQGLMGGFMGFTLGATMAGLVL